MSDSLQPHEPQHAGPLCASPTPRVHPNPRPSSQWCHPAISLSVVPFSSCPQSFPASGSFLMSQLFASGGQSTGVSASASVLPMNTHNCSPLGWTCWISLQSKGFSRVFSNITVQKHQFSGAQFIVQLSHPYMTTGKTIALTRWTLSRVLTYFKRPLCWERLKVGREGDNREWDGWMASPTQWTWVWVNSGHWWWTGRPGVLQSTGSQRVRHDWETELKWA